ncbi:MAG: SMP-30/gluconolactonase/LRE family protein [Pseudomonadota bacterium]
MIFDDRICALGEGPLWHPVRQQLFWFDILGKRLLTPGQEWTFDDHVSAAGWVDRDTLMIASETGLSRFDIPSGQTQQVVPLEADNPITRSNDGRADPRGGFWIGTMGKKTEPFAGAIYRYYRGSLRKLFDRITIPNAICFAPCGTLAYYTDTYGQQVMRVPLDAEGWPGAAEIFLDLKPDGLNPDGAVIDAAGRFWCAQWGASRVACYTPDGQFQHAVSVPASQASCPAFGGPDLTTLFVTTAATGVQEADAGKTFAMPTAQAGLPEHQVIL